MHLEGVAGVRAGERVAGARIRGHAVDAVDPNPVLRWPIHGDPESREHVAAGQLAKRGCRGQPAAQIHLVVGGFVLRHADMVYGGGDAEWPTRIPCGQSVGLWTATSGAVAPWC